MFRILAQNSVKVSFCVFFYTYYAIQKVSAKHHFYLGAKPCVCPRIIRIIIVVINNLHENCNKPMYCFLFFLLILRVSL